MICPLCEHELESPQGISLVKGFVVTEHGKMSLGWVMETVFKRLLKGPASTEELIVEVYGYRNASPEKPANSLHSNLSRLRPELAILGWQVVNPNPNGSHREGIYVLKKLEKPMT